MTRILRIALGLCSLFQVSFSQNISITGPSPNYYLKVDEVFTNSVRVTQTLANQLSQFTPGDKILIIQMTGVTLDNSDGFKTKDQQFPKSMANTGTFEILQLEEVVTDVDTFVYFTHDITYSYDNGERLQLVKLIEGETVTVNGTLTVRAWDGHVGGILGIIGIDTIKMAVGSTIDVSASGFRGGDVPDEVYTGPCRYGLSDIILDTLYFLPTELNRSGNKGEGIVTVSWPYTKGTGYNINGGGAGNGLFAGGGGGSNYAAGGGGGQQSASCVLDYPVDGGWGGYACDELYRDFEKLGQVKIIMGGGGGSGNRMEGSEPSRGGNGGGMAILITGTLVTGPNASIKANGEHTTQPSTAGSGAGGGAGGTLVIDAAHYQGQPFNVSLRGGNGSSTTTTSLPNGAGGGGSGGVIWHAGDNIPSTMVVESLQGGAGGNSPNHTTYPKQLGSQGFPGVRLTGLISPLTGFLFNSIHGTDTVCANQVPNELKGSQPKGGDGSYDFVWEQSTDSAIWSPVSGIGEPTLRNFRPGPLTQTTMYRRIVSSVNPESLESIYDTSRVVRIYVYNAITGNTIQGTDTICYNSDAKILPGSTSLSLGGGNNSYSFVWQESTDLVQWNNTGGTEFSFDPGRLTDTTHFRRIVNSTKYCSDTTGHVTVTVLPAIENNNFAVADTSICENTSPEKINITKPTGGDGKYTYQWQYRTAGAWSSIPSTDDSVTYSAGILLQNTSYRRIVYSGYNDACIDTTNAKNVIVRLPVGNNFVEGSAVKYTCYNSSVTLTGSLPENGFGPGTYGYNWQESIDNNTWQNAGATTQDFESGNIITTRYFRRIVYSTPQYRECSDTSNVVEVRTNQLPLGNVLESSDTICAGSTLYVKFNISGNGPFNVSIRGENEAARSIENVTGPIDSIAFNPQITQEFIVVSVENDNGCFADPAGFVPVIPGKVYEYPVADAGPDNSVCGPTATLAAIRTNESYKGLWTATGVIFTDPTDDNTTVTIDAYGPRIFKWTETNWHCVDEDETEITFFEEPDVPDAGPDLDLVFTYTTRLQASTPSVGSGSWSVLSGSALFDDINRPDAVVSELDDHTVLEWTVTNGSCPVVSDSMKIIVSPLIINKAFTPNGNGKNDEFDPGAEHAERISIRVFNSAGVLVYESANYGEGGTYWDGHNMNGVKLPEGTYYYIMNIKVAGRQREVQFRSFIELMR